MWRHFSQLAAVSLVACSAGPGPHDAGPPPPPDAGVPCGLDGGACPGRCAMGEHPSAAYATAMTALVHPWHLWGQRTSNTDAPLTAYCDLARGFDVYPIAVGPHVGLSDAGFVDGGVDPADVEGTACAAERGEPIPITALAIQAPASGSCGPLPCEMMDVRLVWDATANVGTPYQYFANGDRSVIDPVRYHLEGARLFQSTSASGGFVFEASADGFVCR